MTDPRRFTDYYIWGTVAFVAADLVAGLNLRIPGLTHEPFRWGYYALLLILGFMARSTPGLAPWIGVGESLVNLVLAILRVLLPIWSLPSVLDQGLEPADAVMGVSEVVGVGLAGAVFLSGVYVGLGQARSPQGG